MSSTASRPGTRLFLAGVAIGVAIGYIFAVVVIYLGRQ